MNYSWEKSLSKITSTGAMTFCFIDAIEHRNASTYGSLLSSMRNSIRSARGGGGSSGGGAVVNSFAWEVVLGCCFKKPIC
ncbi:putative metacaspase type I, plant [Helianthus anomalus]